MFSAVVVPIDPDKATVLVSEKKTKERGDTRAVAIFKAAFIHAELDCGEMQRVRGDGQELKMVRRDRVRAEFEARFTTDDGDSPKVKKDAVRMAFNRAIESAVKKWNLLEGNWSGTDWLWKLPEKK